jgi:hypothetical protein
VDLRLGVAVAEDASGNSAAGTYVGDECWSGDGYAIGEVGWPREGLSYGWVVGVLF